MHRTRRLWRLPALFLALLLVIAACDGVDEEVADDEAPADEAEEPADEEEPADDVAAEDCDDVSVSASHHITSASAAHRGLETLAEEVAEGTDGRVDIDIFSDAQLGGLAEMPENLMSGAVDIALVDAGSMSQFEDELGVTDLPFVFEEMDDFNNALDGEFGDAMNERIRDLGIEPLYWAAVGPRSMVFGDDREVTGPDDLQGLTMRVPEAPVWVDTFEALGTSPTAIEAGELYTAVETGVVDGFELPHGTIVDLSLEEVGESMTLTGHIFTHILIAASPAFVDGLCEPDREALMDAVEVAREDTRAGWEQDNAEAEEVLFAELNVVEDPDLDAFREATQPVHDDFVADYGDELYSILMEELGTE